MRVILATLVLLAVAGPVTAQSARWQHERLVDPIDDRVRGIASIESAPLPRRFSAEQVLASSSLDSRPTYLLMVKCDFGSQQMYVSLVPPFGATRRNATVTTRFDRDEPSAVRWTPSGSTLNLISPDDVSLFVARARTANRIVVRVEGGGPTETAIISGAGSATAIASAYRACGSPVP